MTNDKDPIILQAERHQKERRGWHQAGLEQNETASLRHAKATRSIFNILLVRAVFELAILVALIVGLLT